MVLERERVVATEREREVVRKRGIDSLRQCLRTALKLIVIQALGAVSVFKSFEREGLYNVYCYFLAHI